MTNVTATAMGGNDTWGVSNLSSSSPVMINVTATASGGSGYNYCVHNDNSSSPTMTNVTVTALGGSDQNYGIYNHLSSTAKISHSVIKGTSYSVFNAGDEDQVYIGNTRFEGSVSIRGTATCAGVHDENYTFYASSCP